MPEASVVPISGIGSSTWVIWNDGVRTYARNTRTNQFMSNLDAVTVWQAVANALTTTGGKATICSGAPYIAHSKYNHPSNVDFEGEYTGKWGGTGVVLQSDGIMTDPVIEITGPNNPKLSNLVIKAISPSIGACLINTPPSGVIIDNVAFNGPGVGVPGSYGFKTTKVAGNFISIRDSYASAADYAWYLASDWVAIYNSIAISSNNGFAFASGGGVVGYLLHTWEVTRNYLTGVAIAIASYDTTLIRPIVEFGTLGGSYGTAYYVNPGATPLGIVDDPSIWAAGGTTYTGFGGDGTRIRVLSTTRSYWRTSNSGQATGTGAQQTIAHGVSFTPNYNQVLLTNLNNGANPYISAVPDATNIYVTAGLGLIFRWEVKLFP
jgi:hypothetical protein